MIKHIEVLLVEDNSDDADLMQELLAKAKIAVNLNIVDDGVKAMSYLRREYPYAHAVPPALILLDFNLPRKDGRETLNDIKKDESLKHIPVVVLTTSDADADILNCYSLGANSYVTKPVGLDQFARIIRALEEFWFTVVKLPQR
ncbi:MAG: response regulator [Chloroflexi bacterium]|nr:response regulator [Chloroflexota bacterium]